MEDQVAPQPTTDPNSTLDPPLLPPPPKADPNSKRSVKRKLKAQEKQEKRAKRKADDAVARSAAQTQDSPTASSNAKVIAPSQADMQLSERSQKKKEEFLGKLPNATTVLIDCEWEDALTKKELNSLVQQIMYCYGANKAASAPVNVVLSGVKADGVQMQKLTKISGFSTWIGFRCESEPYMSVFDSARLVYLTADADDVLDKLDPNAVYIIGGIVDRNRLKGVTQRKAAAQGIKSARLPIQEHVDMGDFSSVLTVNHVMDILLEFHKTGDWPKALERGVPGRKKAREKDAAQHEKSAKANGEAKCETSTRAGADDAVDAAQEAAPGPEHES